MKKESIKDYNKRLNFFKEEKKILLLKFIIRSTILPKYIREKAQNCFSKWFNFNFSKVKIKNRCIFTSRARSINQKMKMSRITFRKLASQGLLLGTKKSSW